MTEAQDIAAALREQVAAMREESAHNRVQGERVHAEYMRHCLDRDTRAARRDRFAAAALTGIMSITDHPAFWTTEVVAGMCVKAADTLLAELYAEGK